MMVAETECFVLHTNDAWRHIPVSERGDARTVNKMKACTKLPIHDLQLSPGTWNVVLVSV